MAIDRLKVSVIMPAFNEEKDIVKAVENSLNALIDYDIDGQVIVVNDGSIDRTGELITSLASEDPRIKAVHHEKSKGIGASFWDGVDAADGDTIVMIPGDNENDPWEILRYHRLLNHVDIVIPFVFNKEVRSILRNALSFIYRFIINSTFLVHFNYTNGTVFYRRSVLKEMEHRSAGFFFQTDILIRAVKRGYLFAEVPYRLDMREEGVSKAVTFPSLIKVIKGYLHLVKDVYYLRREKNAMKIFAPDSLTLERRKNVNEKFISEQDNTRRS